MTTKNYAINNFSNWLPRSCVLTPSDFILWGHVKDKVYADAPQSIQELKEKIRAKIRKRSRGVHINYIVFYC